MESLESRQLLSGTTTVLMQDDFSGQSVNGNIWHIPTWTPDGSTYLGRTQLAVAQNASPPHVSGGAVHLTLDTYNPTGFSFYGTELISNKTFKIGTGLDVKIRAKLNAPIPGGVVGGLFLYMLKPGGTNHDEVDTELLSNQIATGGNNLHTNVYANEPLGAGSPLLRPLPGGGKLAGYHTYQMKCEPGRVTWYVDGVLVRSERVKVPAGPVKVYLNIWAPAQEWPAAYNSKIQPTSTAAKNKRYSMDVDSVLVRSVKPGA
ncbi:MAG: glycoside hydrolase family 16 protein [Tepidisphaerales bacterium]